jgi:sterol carrier protein 2
MQAPGLFGVPDKRGKFGLVHNIGLGGAVVVSLLRRPEFYKVGGTDGRTRFVIFLHSLSVALKGMATD